MSRLEVPALRDPAISTFYCHLLELLGSTMERGTFDTAHAPYLDKQQSQYNQAAGSSCTIAHLCKSSFRATLSVSQVLDLVQF